ncbi:putative ubiquitinyl hydrolase 1 [Lupinus albus]|uniref:Ubiquitin carboxyl-terminal hydrolase n=1 Tax=Lupinus albus TaxID=3870 RepID=A0A6A4Q340_LUPAL|nr:putative ubiquitinyl hydrolase 1 [Lupinus albus]
MGKKVRKKSRIAVKNKEITTDSVSVSVTKDTNNSCPHLLKGVNLNTLSTKIASSYQLRCQDCADRKGNKGKGKHGKNKGSSDSKSESKAIWVCLYCAQFTCGGVGLPTSSECHAVRHASLTRHPLVIHLEKPQLCWCFHCKMPIQLDRLQETDETSRLLSDAAKLLKGRPSGKTPLDTEDVHFSDGSVTSEIKSKILFTTANSNGQGGYVARGMVNLGNTCFFNSIMQILLAMNKLRNNFLNLDAPVEGALTSSLKKLFNEINPESGLRNIINPRSFFGCVCSKYPQFRGYQQHDSHEYLCCLLDGLSTEELAARKQNGSPKKDGTTPNNTLVDALFGGQISSTVCCIDCGHFSTVYEPFLDLSLPVPTKKSPPRKAQHVSRTKKSKLPPKKGGKTRYKGNKDANHLPVQSLLKQSSSHVSSCPAQSNISSVAGEMLDSSADYTVLGSGEISSMTEKQNSSSPNSVAVEEPQHTLQVHDNATEETSASADDFTWLDFVEAVVVDEGDSISQKEDTPEVHDTRNNNECLNELHVQAASCESSGPFCFLKDEEDQNLRPDSSSANRWEDEVPLQVQGSEVLLLPYKEESSSTAEITGYHVFAGPAPRPSSSGGVKEAGFIVGNSNSESDPDEVDDADTPVSVESCLAHFIKPELLSDDNAWHCENCSKTLCQKMETYTQAKNASDGNETRCHDESGYAACSVKVGGIGNGDMGNEKNVESSVSHVKLDTKLESGQINQLNTNNIDRDHGALGMKDNEELQSSGSHKACNEVSCDRPPADSSTTLHMIGTIQKGDSQMLGQDNNDSDECSEEEAGSKSVKVKRDATKRVLIYKAPPVLTIHLKRFSQDARGRLSKLNGHVSFRERMDLRPYMNPGCISEENYEYNLVGVVEHSGSMRGGHYVAYVRGGQRNTGNANKEVEGSTWYHASDAYVREASFNEVLRCEAYILFYEKN